MTRIFRNVNRHDLHSFETWESLYKKPQEAAQM